MRSTLLTEAIARTEETVDTAASSPQTRRRRGLFGILVTQRSDTRFTTPGGTIWKNARLS
jgi:hypothetical protein